MISFKKKTIKLNALETRELMEEVFPLTDQVNLLSNTSRYDTFLTTQYMSYGTNSNTNQYQSNTNQYQTNTNQYQTNTNQYQSNVNQYASNNYNANYTDSNYNNNTCNNVTCSPLLTKRDSFRRHSAHGRYSAGI